MSAVRRVRHPMLEPVPSDAAAADVLESVRSDRERAAFLLQGAALQAHLAKAGWSLSAWEELRVDTGRVLRLPPALVAPGPDERLPQAALRPLVALLFGGDEAPGRSSVRLQLRPMFASWRDALLPIAWNRLVADVLARASFLWTRSSRRPVRPCSPSWRARRASGCPSQVLRGGVDP